MAEKQGAGEANIGARRLADELQKQYGADRFKDIEADKREEALLWLEKVFGDT